MNKMNIAAKSKILIVDDEPELLNSLSILLEDRFNVLTAASGREALSIIKTIPLSLLILDLKMPELGGIELIEYLRNANSKVPIIILTGDFDYSINLLDQNSKMCVIQKPVSIDALIDKIRKILGIC